MTDAWQIGKVENLRYLELFLEMTIEMVKLFLLLTFVVLRNIELRSFEYNRRKISP